MSGSIKDRLFWAKIVPVLVWHIIYLLLSNSINEYLRIYFDLIFYLGIAIYFFILGEWSFAKWKASLKTGKIFWIPVLLTISGLVISYSIGFGISMLFPNANDGLAVFKVYDFKSLISFAIVTMFLPPIAEDVFYRKALTIFDSKTTIIFSATIGIALYASVHSMMPLGFLQACLWGIPMSVAYVKTRNVYVCMTAHFLCNFVVNGITVVNSAIYLMMR